jgi:acetyl-CoA C-acetyltransferase
MGITAENIAEKWGISREDQDQLAVESHKRASAAWAEGRFAGQIVPIEIKSRKGTTLFEKDEHFRTDATMDGMAKLRPIFKKDGTVTAANASGINDAASALVLASAEAAEAQGLKPMARLVGYAFAGCEPKYMGIGPVPAVRRLFEDTGMSVGDFDVFEVNEAFAAQALAVARDLDLPMDKTNPNGSGISLGHPIGATGSIVTTKAIHELHRTGGRYALVTMCIGGGQGIAAAFERI